MAAAPPIKRIRWTQAYRIVPSRFPTVGVFDRIAAPADLEALFALEALTNPRLREQLGALRMLPPERRVSGPGTTPIMAAFTHLNPAGSRFSDGSWGVFYAAHDLATAVEETVFHREQFLAATAEPACDIQMRCYRTAIAGRLHDIRGGWPELHDPHSYVASKAFAQNLHASGANGIVYDSARRAGGQCAALFYPDLVAPCVQGAHLLYRWDGQRIAQVLEISEWRRAGASITAAPRA
jgi:hypothetical protein